MAPSPPRPALLLALAVAATAAWGCPAAPAPSGLKPSVAPKKKPSPSPSPSESPLPVIGAGSVAPTQAPSISPDAPPTSPAPSASAAPSPAASQAPVAPPSNAPKPSITMPFASPVVATLAGAEAAFAEGPGAAARFNSPNGIDVDGEGRLYVADAGNHRIRLVQKDGTTSTYAGAGEGWQDGPPDVAKFKSPYGVAVAKDALYVADTENHRIRKITVAEGVTTLAGDGTPGFLDGQGTAARFKSPFSVAVGPDGSVYVADAGNRRIRKIDQGGVVTTVAGTGEAGSNDGPLASAKFAVPNDLAADGADGLYVVDGINHNVRYVDFKLNIVRTLAGSGQAGNVDGIGVRAKLNSPSGLALVEGGVLVADTRNHKVRFLKKDGTLVTVVGVPEAGFADGGGGAARMNEPTDLVVGPDGVAYLTDTKNARIRTLK